MNKLPTKQIYLLLIIIVGIFALSIYSTYAIFTFESETSDIVSIHTPKSLKISVSSNEYQQVEIPANEIITVDVDIYNTQEYDICYSIWYKVLGEESITDKVVVFEKTTENLKTSGMLGQNTNLRVQIAIINDNDELVKVNIGTSSSKLEDTCSLNFEEGKNMITDYVNSLETLSSKILLSKEDSKESEKGYLTYQSTNSIELNNNDKLVIAKEFTYDNEIFTLVEPIEINVIELLDYYLKDNYYFCQNSLCDKLIKIMNLSQTDNTIVIETYQELRGYQSTISGLRKIADNYIYYGDNPNNFIKFNCNSENCELWRIIGLYYDKISQNYQIKIIRNDSIGPYKYAENLNEASWQESNINKYLNNNYDLNGYDKYLNDFYYQEENLKDFLEITTGESISINETKLGIISLNDYLTTSSCENLTIEKLNNECLKNNWLNIPNQKEWTIANIEEIVPHEEETINNEENTDPLEEENPEEVIPEQDEEIPNEEEEILEEEKTNKIIIIGNAIESSEVTTENEVRPVGYLTKRILYVGGNGTLENPYIIK